MNIKSATVDFVLSAGPACRPAYHTQKLGMRMFASPCDWMIVHSLEDWIHILEYEAEDMFQKSYIDEDKQYVVDERNGMISMHHFNCDQSLDSQIPSFSWKMKKRAINTANAISQSKSVGIVMNRIIRAEELVAFAERLCSLFTRTSFHILNVKDTPQQGVSVSYEAEGERYVIQEVSFNDEHPLGGKNLKMIYSGWATYRCGVRCFDRSFVYLRVLSKIINLCSVLQLLKVKLIR